jgi:hypothetical protein
MTGEIPQFQGDGETIVSYVMDPKNPSTDPAMKLYMNSDIWAWADERELTYYGELIQPKAMYIKVTDDDMHHVAWVRHKGVREIGGLREAYDLHHVVCDCVSMHEDSDSRLEAVFECEGVRKVLAKRAEDVGQTLQAYELIAHYLGLSESELEVRFSPEQIQQIIGTSVVHMLETDFLHPETWMANMRSGALVVSAVARTLQLERQEIIPTLDTMRANGIVDHDTYTVRFGPQAFDPNEDEKNPVIFVRYVEREDI